MLGTDDAPALDDRFKTIPVRTQILRRFLSLGMIVVILAGIPAQNVFLISLPVGANAVPTVIAYFVLGIILLSLTRYISLETTWWEARLHIPAQIPRRWFAYSALILVMLVLLIGCFTHKLWDGLFDTLNAVFYVIYQFIQTLYGLILLLITLIIHLLSKAIPEPPTPQFLTSPLQPEILPAPALSTFNWELVKSVLLWGSLIVLVIIAVRQYIAFNRDLSEELRRFRPLRWLLAAWDRFKASFKKANKSVGTYIQNSLKRLRRLVPQPSKP